VSHNSKPLLERRSNIWIARATRLALCTLGSFSLAFSIVVFLSPNHIVTGGPPGIAIILFYSMGIAKGATILVVNVALMLLGVRKLGAAFIARTCYVFTATAAFTELLTHLMHHPAVTGAPLLNALYGGVLVGVGIGLAFRGGASAGGWSLLAQLIAERTRLGVGQCIFLLDSCVLTASAIVFRDIESVLWAGIGIYVAGLVVDLVLTGRSGAKVVQVSTQRTALLAHLLPERLREVGGRVHCNTMTDRDGRDVMFLVVDTGQINLLRELVRANDPDAYMVVTDAVEFYGGGAS
jgi:uncharacterized membrane-anchored protein YitT (DUF2179 family)